MAHNHKHHHNAADRSSILRLIVTFFLNLLITVAEIIGGVISGSLSLISDALHNFSDAVAVGIAYFAIRLKLRPKNQTYTFGYKRAEILAAVFNAAVLIGISFYLFFEAYERFISPAEIDSSLMMKVAIIGLAANISGTILLKRDSKSSMNIRSAYLHLFSDAVSSVGVIVGAFFISIWQIYWIDPLLTVLISIYIIKESYDIVKESLTVLMMASPPNISLEKLEQSIRKIENVHNIHHVHLWRIDEHDIHFEAHVEVPDLAVSETEKILAEIESNLRSEFAINHVTIQFECDRCGVKKLV